MELKLVLESLLFVSQKPLSVRELRDHLKAAAEQTQSDETKAFQKTREEEIVAALEELERDYAAQPRSFRPACIAGSWQLVSQPEFAPWIRAIVGEKSRPSRLSQPALETLAIVAYRQPLTRAEIEQIRGVAVDGVMATLVERGLVEQVGRSEAAGRPITYGTTQLFLEYFGLRGLEELPAADELRRIVVTRPESLETAEAPAETAATEPAPDTPSEPAGEASSPAEEQSAASSAPEDASNPEPQP